MRKVFALLIITVLLAGWATPVLADGFGISPPQIEFEVPAEASQEVEFMVYNFTGELKVSLENIPLRVEPTVVPVEAPAGGIQISLTFYGDESLGSKIYQGKIRFLASTGSMVATGIKVRATVTNLVEGETPVLVEPAATLPASSGQQETSSPSPESQNPSGESQGVTILPPSGNPESGTSGTPTPPVPPSPNGGNGDLPVVAIIGIIAGAVVVIVLIIVIVRRPKY